MLRCALFAVAVCAIVPATRAADPDLSGNWLLSYSSAPGLDQNFAILKVESKDGKTTASIVYPAQVKLKDFKVSGMEVTAGTSIGPVFVGTVGADGKVVVGSFGDDSRMFRAKLTPTDKDTIAQGDTITRTPGPDEFAKAVSMAGRVTTLRLQANREKDADTKKDLLAKMEEAQKEADEKAPALFREAASKYAGTDFGTAAATALLSSAGKFKVTADEATKLVAQIEKQSAEYGPRYVTVARAQIADALSQQKDLAAVAIAVIEPMVKALTDKTKAAEQVKVLGAYKTALTNAGKTDMAKDIDGRLAKLETKIDEEYLASVPPFKPAAYAGRKESGANKVAVMELFTGAQCPPCVAADVAFDALAKAYKPSELVLIQYHLHIPGPDPMTNADAQARAKYYAANSTPTTFFNGKADARGGGGMPQAEGKFKQYTGVIDPILEAKSDVKLSGTATRTGDKLSISVAADGADGEDMKLRLLVVEETVKYVGSNQLRFHHHVVRAMPGGADGVAVKDKSFKHTATADVSAIRGELTKYLDDYAANTRPFPKADRPLDMKHLKVIALVQNDKTKEIVGAVQLDLDEKGASR